MVIKTNQNMCLGVEKCGKCLKVCPFGVFMIVPKGKYVKGKKPDYKLIPYFISLCNNCSKCVDICPNSAIRLE